MIVHKHTIETIKPKFDEINYELTSEIYVDQKTLLNYICDKGHKNERSYSNFSKAKYKCLECTKVNKNETYNKLSINKIRIIFEENGYQLVSTEYKNAYSKLKCKCPNGHDILISFGKFHYRGTRCVKCSDRTMWTIELISEKLAEFNCTLLSTEYNTSLPIKFKCAKGHINDCMLNDFLRSIHKCGKCAVIATGDRCRYKYSEIKEFLNNIGYTLVTTEEEYSNIKHNALNKIKFKWTHK